MFCRSVWPYLMLGYSWPQCSNCNLLVPRGPGGTMCTVFVGQDGYPKRGERYRQNANQWYQATRMRLVLGLSETKRVYLLL